MISGEVGSFVVTPRRDGYLTVAPSPGGVRRSRVLGKRPVPRVALGVGVVASFLLALALVLSSVVPRQQATAGRDLTSGGSQRLHELPQMHFGISCPEFICSGGRTSPAPYLPGPVPISTSFRASQVDPGFTTNPPPLTVKWTPPPELPPLLPQRASQQAQRQAPPLEQRPESLSIAIGYPSLYCVEVMCPFGYEIDLLRFQFSHRRSIFSCEGFQVFSNISFDLAPDLQVEPFGGTMVVPHGGRWGTALNTDVFVRFWRALSRLRVYAKYDWTIKVDPDTVFFPFRLQEVLACGPECGLPGIGFRLRPGPVFLNNCKYGLHGGLEALSRDAITRFLGGMDSCNNVYNAAMDIDQPAWLDPKDHGFGEDQYLRRCLIQLGVPKVDEYPVLLSELRACGKPYPTDCGDPRVAFHAMKNVPDWDYCWTTADGYGHWPELR